MAWRPRRWNVPGKDRLNVGCGRDVKTDPGWVNMDAFYDDPRVVKHDMVKTPWPFKANAFDVVYASHVLEHVPPVFREHKGTQRDALFDVVEEIHRVLRPDGILHAAIPLGGTHAGLMNPQHYRQWRPDWFDYFDQRNGEARGYHTANFQKAKFRFNRTGFRAKDFLRIGPNGHPLSVHLFARLPFLRPFLRPKDEMEVQLRAVKDARGA